MARYDQCDDTCTTDCGHCKGAGVPALPKPFETNSPMNRQMAIGHMRRKGHRLVGHYIESAVSGETVILVRTCCKER